MHLPLARRLAAGLLVPVFAAGLPSVASAQSDKPAAELLLKQGLELEAAGKFPEACAKLEVSLQLYPSLNTEYHLADCFERIGRAASALLEFNEIADKAHAAGEGAKEAKARERAAAVAPKVSHLTVIVAGDTPGLEVKRNGTAINPLTWGTQLPIDAGEIAIEASAPGKETFRTKVTVKRDGDDVKVEIPALPETNPTRPPAKVGAPTPATAVTAASAEPTVDSGTSDHSGRRAAAFITGGLGLAALGAGAYFASHATSLQRDADDLGAQGNAGDAAAKADSARSAVTLARVGLGLGVIGVGVATYLFVTSKSDEAPTPNASASVRVAPVLSVGFAGLEVGGGW